MSSRDKILEALRVNKPAEQELATLHFYRNREEDLLTRFYHTLKNIGGGYREVQGFEEISTSHFEKQKPGIRVINAVEQLPGCNVGQYVNASARELESTDVFWVKGSVAVAENGAIWIREKDMGNRLLPFLSRQLVIVVEEKDLVSNLHEAYEKIAIDEEGYGAFIAGPSKTADIEQSLVIGAHGPLGLEVFMIKS